MRGKRVRERLRLCDLWQRARLGLRLGEHLVAPACITPWTAGLSTGGALRHIHVPVGAVARASFGAPLLATVFYRCPPAPEGSAEEVRMARQRGAQASSQGPRWPVRGGACLTPPSSRPYDAWSIRPVLDIASVTLGAALARDH